MTRIPENSYAAAARALLDAAGQYARAGETEAALESLRGALESGAVTGDWLSESPDLRSLRDDPRFRELFEDLRVARAS